jgi:hypothetical protein
VLSKHPQLSSPFYKAEKQNSKESSRDCESFLVVFSYLISF